MLTHTKKVWCWSKAKHAALKEAIEDANWDEFYEATSVNTAWQRWKSILLPLAENHIPQRTPSSTIPPKPWITAEIRAQIREKHRLYRRCKKKRCPEAWEKYRQVRNAVASHLKKSKITLCSEQAGGRFVTRERPARKPRGIQLQTATVTNSAAKFAQAKASRYSGSVQPQSNFTESYDRLGQS